MATVLSNLRKVARHLGWRAAVRNEVARIRTIAKEPLLRVRIYPDGHEEYDVFCRRCGTRMTTSDRAELRAFTDLGHLSNRCGPIEP